MKKLLIILFAVIIFSGCGDGANVVKCRMSVENKYPSANVIQLPDVPYRFIVITETEILYVRTNNNFDAEISDSVKLAIINKGD